MYIPDFCYALNNVTINPKTKVGKVIKIKALETGYYKTDMTATQEEVNHMNQFPDAGEPVDIATAKAMTDASLFGWNCYIEMLASHKRIAEKGENKNEPRS